MVPTPGRIVMYQLTEDDARRITHQRTHNGQRGNFVTEGQEYPAVVVRTFPGNPDGVCNLRVLLDGEDTPYWATSRHEGMAGEGMTVDSSGFHAREGWYFRREDDGSVRILAPDSLGPGAHQVVTLDADTWASVVASVSHGGETGESFRTARRFHDDRTEEGA